jgi:hypothetical protein
MDVRALPRFPGWSQSDLVLSFSTSFLEALLLPKWNQNPSKIAHLGNFLWEWGPWVRYSIYHVCSLLGGPSGTKIPPNWSSSVRIVFRSLFSLILALKSGPKGCPKWEKKVIEIQYEHLMTNLEGFWCHLGPPVVSKHGKYYIALMVPILTKSCLNERFWTDFGSILEAKAPPKMMSKTRALNRFAIIRENVVRHGRPLPAIPSPDPSPIALPQGKIDAPYTGHTRWRFTAYIHACIHYLHTYIHTWMNTNITYIHTYTHTHIQTYIKYIQYTQHNRNEKNQWLVKCQ